MLASTQRNPTAGLPPPRTILPTARPTSPTAPATSHHPSHRPSHLSHRSRHLAPCARTRAHLPGAESAFEVPLNDVTQANAQKSDAVVEMADDDTALPEDEMLVELRLHVAATGDGD